MNDIKMKTHYGMMALALAAALVCGCEKNTAPEVSEKTSQETKSNSSKLIAEPKVLPKADNQEGRQEEAAVKEVPAASETKGQLKPKKSQMTDEERKAAREKRREEFYRKVDERRNKTREQRVKEHEEAMKRANEKRTKQEERLKRILEKRDKQQ